MRNQISLELEFEDIPRVSEVWMRGVDSCVWIEERACFPSTVHKSRNQETSIAMICRSWTSGQQKGNMCGAKRVSLSINQKVNEEGEDENKKQDMSQEEQSQSEDE